MGQALFQIPTTAGFYASYYPHFGGEKAGPEIRTQNPA